MPTPLRHQYEAHGAQGYYEEYGADYRNPHEGAIRAILREAFADRSWGLRVTRLLDLACGSGEASIALRDLGCPIERIDACDPYTQAAYARRVGRPAEAHGVRRGGGARGRPARGAH